MIGICTSSPLFYQQISQLIEEAGEEVVKVTEKELTDCILLFTDSYAVWMEDLEVPIFLFGRRRPARYPTDLRHLFYKTGSCEKEKLLQDLGDWYFYLQALEEANRKAFYFEKLSSQEKKKRAEYESHLEKGRLLQSYFHKKGIRNGYSVYSKEKPASQVSGDVFLEYQAGEKLFFCIGDVTDHGYHAGMVGMYVSGAFESYFALEKEPSLISLANHLHEMVSKLTAHLERERNLYCLACLLGVFEEGQVTFLNCGGESPIYFSKEKGAKLLSLEENTCPPIGDDCFPETEKKPVAAKIEENSGYVLFTDGLTDTFRSSKKRDFQNNFSENLVKDSVAVLSKGKSIRPEQIARGVLLDAESFGLSSVLEEEGKVHCKDDCTVACIYKEEKLLIKETLKAKKEVLIPFLKKKVLPLLAGEERGVLHLILEELFVNLYRYGNSEGKEKEVTFALYEGGRYFRFFTEDNGALFNPVAYKPKELEEDAVGGHGIRLVKRLVKEFRYDWKDNKNCIECVINKQGEEKNDDRTECQ